jgi:hypothetical protein
LMTERDEILGFYFNRLLLRSMLAFVRMRVLNVVARHKTNQMKQYRINNLLKSTLEVFKINVVTRKLKKRDPILRRILAMEDKGEDGEFFTVKISNTD